MQTRGKIGGDHFLMIIICIIKNLETVKQKRLRDAQAKIGETDGLVLPMIYAQY